MTSMMKTAARVSAPKPFNLPSRKSEGGSSNLAVYTLAIEPVEETILFSGGADYRVHMWDLRTRTLLHTLTGHTSTVRALCFTPKGDKLCSSGGDFTVCVWAVG